MPLFPALHPTLSSHDFTSGHASKMLDALWQQVEHIETRGVQGVQLHWISLRPAHAKARIVLVPGRIEAVHKYAELLQDLSQAGYEVWAPDHRGQGASARQCANRQLGYVADFDDYCLDLQALLRHVATTSTLPTLLMAHSMGGAILYRTLQLFGAGSLHGVILGSPMFGIPTAPIPTWLALPLAQLAKQYFGKTYVPGQRDYQAKPFIGNDLTNCQPRYDWFRLLYQSHPHYQLGGVSWQWLASALAACQRIAKEPAPTVPMLLLQAGDDTVVLNSAQDLVCQRYGLSRQVIPGAKHELFNGTDQERQQTFAAINQWLAQF